MVKYVTFELTSILKMSLLSLKVSQKKDSDCEMYSVYAGGVCVDVDLNSDFLLWDGLGCKVHYGGCCVGGFLLFVVEAALVVTTLLFCA